MKNKIGKQEITQDMDLIKKAKIKEKEKKEKE